MSGVSGRQMDPFYGDWCNDAVTSKSMATSLQLGLCARACCAGDRCRDRMINRAAPNGGDSVAQPWSTSGTPV